MGRWLIQLLQTRTHGRSSWLRFKMGNVSYNYIFPEHDPLIFASFPLLIVEAFTKDSLVDQMRLKS